jgi:hypothetical protein
MHGLPPLHGGSDLWTGRSDLRTLDRMEPGKPAEQLARELPRATRRLLGDHVHSAGELDLLMLLHRERDRSWRVEEVCELLRCPDGWAKQRLEALRSAGLLVKRDGRYACAPATRELDEALHALEEARRTRWAELTHLIAAPRGRRRKVLSDGGPSA